MPSVDIFIVTWNSASVIRTALASVFSQTLKPENIFIVDNASTDGTREILVSYPQCKVILQKTNIGFSAAHNLIISKSTTDYTLVMNPDVTLQPDYLERLCRFAVVQPKGSAFVGTIFRLDGSVDTTGLAVKPWRLVRDRKVQAKEPKNIFGVSGALALYRRQALLDAAVEGNIFNPLLFAYKEDVEMAWRLQWAGWQAFYVPEAVARHSRAVGEETRRSQRSIDRRFLSYRNHLLLYPLVESWRTLTPDLWVIIPAEIFRGLILLFTDPLVTTRALAAAAKMWHAARTFARRERRAVPGSQVRSAFHL